MSAAVLRWHNPGWAAAMPSRQPGHRIWPTAVRGTEYNSLRDRDHESWNVLFDQEAPAIYRYALSRLGDAGLAEEATSDVFEAAWKGAESYTDRGLPARAWLFGIARHVVASQQRRWRRRAPQISIDAYVESGLYDELLDGADPFLATATEWKTDLAQILPLQRPPLLTRRRVPDSARPMPRCGGPSAIVARHLPNRGLVGA